ncbi:MAG: CxxC-x17-CxxC domain-containing protein [Patescibacteria group bacterium]
MNKFRKPHGSAGRDGNRFGGRPEFRRPGGSGFDKKMYPAICAECGNKCEVPFRPNGRKPVYCLNCFGKNERGESRPLPTNDFRERTPSSPATFKPQNEDRRLDDIKRQLDTIYSKLENILQVVSAPKTEGTIKEVPAKKKVVATKRTASKKK